MLHIERNLFHDILPHAEKLDVGLIFPVFPVIHHLHTPPNDTMTCSIK